MAAAQTPVEVTAVVSKQVDRKLRLPGEFLPYQITALRARVSGFVEKVEVDRGSVVKTGDLLVTLSAPEMQAQVTAAEAKVATAQAQKSEAEARLVSAQSTFERLKKAAETPGAVAGNEVIVAEKAVEAARAAVAAEDSAIAAARASVAALKDLMNYLRITAPFDGVITERFVHPGALASPTGEALLELQQVARLRLVVAVPEGEFSGIIRGAKVAFTVPAYPAETFSGTIARVSKAIDPKTRTMPVELDVANANGRLAPGMYPEVQWPVRKARASLLVPPTAVVTTTERVFVIRVRDGKAEWVNVSKGPPAGDLIEVFGALNAGDSVVKRGTDEIREGSRLAAK
jgi:RND family efflux transporter MFP subunit